MENREIAEQEMIKILEWANNEERRAIEKLKKEQKYKGGLDGSYPELQSIKEESNKRLRELQAKYRK